MYVITKLLSNSPPMLIITLAEAKTHLRLDHDDDDLLITSLIEAAGELLKELTQLALSVETYRVATDWCERSIKLKVMPAISITSVNYRDGDGDLTLIDPINYWLDKESGRLRFKSVFNLNSSNSELIIDYVAGYEDVDIPKPLQQAAKLLIGHYYDNQNILHDNRQKLQEDCPASVTHLIRAYSIKSLGYGGE